MLNRKQAPTIHSIDSVTTLPAELVALTPALTVHVLRSSLQPVLRLDVVFPAGRWYEQAEGIAHLAAKMLLEGTRKHTAAEIAEFISFYGASISCQANADYATLTLYCLKKHFEPLLHLVNELLTETAFPEQEFDQQKIRTAQSIQVERQKNNYLATEALTGKIFGQNNPYKAGMQANSVEKVSLQQVKGFFRSHFLVNAAHIFIAGDVEETHLRLLHELTQETARVTEEPLYLQNPEINLSKISTANNLQAAIQLGRSCPEPGSPEYYSLQILNEALGGYFGSRLMKNIREDKGYTYGIFSQIVPRKHATFWTVRTEVNSENADKAYQEIEIEFKRLADQPIGNEELEVVQSSLLGKFITERATIFDQLEWHKFLVLNNLSENFFAHYSQAINNISAAELQSFAKSYLSIKDWSAVIVGP